MGADLESLCVNSLKYAFIKDGDFQRSYDVHFPWGNCPPIHYECKLAMGRAMSNGTIEAEEREDLHSACSSTFVDAVAGADGRALLQPLVERLTAQYPGVWSWWSPGKFIGQVGRLDATPETWALIQRMSLDDNGDLRRTAAAMMETCDPATRAACVAQLGAMFTDADSTVQQAAIEALRNNGPLPAHIIGDLLKVAVNDEGPPPSSPDKQAAWVAREELRTEAIKTLGTSGTKDTTDIGAVLKIAQKKQEQQQDPVLIADKEACMRGRGSCWNVSTTSHYRYQYGTAVDTLRQIGMADARVQAFFIQIFNSTPAHDDDGFARGTAFQGLKTLGAAARAIVPNVRPNALAELRNDYEGESFQALKAIDPAEAFAVSHEVLQQKLSDLDQARGALYVAAAMQTVDIGLHWLQQQDMGAVCVAGITAIPQGIIRLTAMLGNGK